MDISLHRPVISAVYTLDSTHAVDIGEERKDGLLTLFIDADWSQWDALVDAVTSYRNQNKEKSA